MNEPIQHTCIDWGVWVASGRLHRWLHGIQQSSGDDVGFFCYMCASCLSLTSVNWSHLDCCLWANGTPSLLCPSWSKWVRKEKLTHSLCFLSSQCMHRFLTLEHSWSSSGSCSLQAAWLLAYVLAVLMLQDAFPKATDISSPSCFSNPGLCKYSRLSPSCGGMWLLQLVPYYLKTNTCKPDVIWHGNKLSP